MRLELIENVIRLLGGSLAYSTLAIILFGIWRGTQRPVGRTSGSAGAWLRSGWFYLITTLLFIGICFLGWMPFLQIYPTAGRAWILGFGCLLYFPGLLFVLWGRLALGKNYFVSTGLGAQLFAGHQLIASGPFAIVRHPMYTGLCLAALGSLLIYSTWTTLLFACFAPMLILRSRRDEIALAAEFGEQWQEYCKRVPAFFPKIRREPQK